MKRIMMVICLLGLAAFSPVSTCLAADQADLTAPPAGRQVKQYLPGDYVHVIVDAPPDTAAITSILPNGERIELAHDRRANIWHGLWQVPIGFKVGTYTAGLQARDIEGNVFEGETSPFMIGELALISLIKKPPVPTPEAAAAPETKEQVSRRLGIETAKMAAKTEPTPPKPRPSVKKKPRPVTRKKMVFVEVPKVEVGKNRELNLKKAKLLATTRYYMEKMQFGMVRSLLVSLVEIDPANKEYRKMLRRVDTVLQMEKEKNR